MVSRWPSSSAVSSTASSTTRLSARSPRLELPSSTGHLSASVAGCRSSRKSRVRAVSPSAAAFRSSAARRRRLTVAACREPEATADDVPVSDQCRAPYLRVHARAAIVVAVGRLSMWNAARRRRAERMRAAERTSNNVLEALRNRQKDAANEALEEDDGLVDIGTGGRGGCCRERCRDVLSLRPAGRMALSECGGASERRRPRRKQPCGPQFRLRTLREGTEVARQGPETTRYSSDQRGVHV
jgi:hypothetical protein